MLTESQIKRLRRKPVNGKNRLLAAMEMHAPRVTQMGLAQSIGVTQAYVNRLCHGDYADLNLEVSRALADYFGCSIEDLFPARQAVAS